MVMQLTKGKIRVAMQATQIVITITTTINHLTVITVIVNGSSIFPKLV